MPAPPGDLDLVKRLASDPAVSPNWIGPNRGDSPLHRASRFGPVEKIPNVDVNAGNSGKATPFYIACQEEHQEVVSLLLADMRIEMNKPQSNGITPFGVACMKGHKKWCHCSCLT